MAQFGPKLILGLINLIIVAGNGINDCPIACFCDTKNVDSIPGKMFKVKLKCFKITVCNYTLYLKYIAQI